jgi:pantothenate kinase
MENDISILPSHRIVVLEGNYVHLTVPPWDQATKLLDERWFIAVERDVARGRVIKRHLISGIAATEEGAGRRFDENDWPNGEYLLLNSNVQNANRIIQSVQDRDMSKNE